MTIRRLPETDIANLSFRGKDLKRLALTDWLKPKKLPPSYDPLRSSIGEAVNATLPLFDIPLSRSPLASLEALVLAACKRRPDLIAQNMPAVRAVRTFADANGIEADTLEVLPLTVMPGIRYSFWSPLLVRYDGGASVIFLDLRRSGNLTRSGLHFAQSMMHHRFRAADPDFESVRMEVWRFGKDALRTISPIREMSGPLSFDDLMADIHETYEVLVDILSDTEYRSSGAAGGLI